MAQDTWFTDPFAREIFETKYKGERKDIYDLFHFLADQMGQGNVRRKKQFYELMVNKKFSPGGRILAWGGRPDARVSLMNCTTHQVTGDSLEDISETAYSIMRASSRGQGIGIDISRLRPFDSPVNNAAKTSTGAISFMEMFNHVGTTIGQEGRRAALLFSIEDSHPDLYRGESQDRLCPTCNGYGCDECNEGYVPMDFLNIKRFPGVEGANISVKIRDGFMHAVQNNQEWEMQFTGQSGGNSFQYKRTVPATEIFDALAYSAHKAAEPGVLFWDTSERESNSDLFGPEWGIAGVNACSEQVLDQDGVCNLGSMNLAAYVENPFELGAQFNIEEFYYDVRSAIEFLDNVIDVELAQKGYISEQQRYSLEGLRRVGLGVMGLADTLAMLGLEYSTNVRTNAFLHLVFSTMRNAAYEKSINMAIEKGPAKVWEGRDYHTRQNIAGGGFFSSLPFAVKSGIASHGTRNVTLLSIAPTGTISNLFGVSSGIEPLFAPEFTRRVRMNGEDEFINYVHPGMKLAQEKGLSSTVYQTTYDVSVEDHIGVQALVQQYVDQSISKTLNMPKTATPGDVAQAYLLGWKKGLKGMTVYVDESRKEQVLYNKEEDTEACPECGNALIHENGCIDCSVCTYSMCSI